MAKTIKLANFVRPPKTADRPSPRKGAGKPAGLYLLELRSHAAGSQPRLSRRKVVIPVDLKDSSDGFPEPVKITHG
jgi:hypothetical protein